MTGLAPTVAVITAASASRHDHLARQRRLLAQLAIPFVRVEAWLDAEPGTTPPEPQVSPAGAAETGGAEELCTPDVTVHVPPGPHGLRVGAARNAAAQAAIDAGAQLLVFLDVDCLPGPDLLSRYVEAAAADPTAILAGPVTYLASVQRPVDLDDLPRLTRPHPARPMPADDETRVAADGEYDLFWSLSFTVTPATWERLGGFDERYEGYGSEDTDLAYAARARSIPLHWVGGAHAYHQWHPTSSPPWQHLDDILRNGALFAERWGAWPMGGWLDAFAAAGAITWRDGVWQRA